MKDYTKLKDLAKENYTKKDSSCAEAVLRALLDFYEIEHTEKDIHIAAAFGGGIGGCSCVCGTISGAVLGFSYILGEEKLPLEKFEFNDDELKKWKNAYASKYAASLLYQEFKKMHHVSCCKIITHKHEGDPKERKAFCSSLTEEVSEWAAIIIEDYWARTK